MLSHLFILCVSFLLFLSIPTHAEKPPIARLKQLAEEAQKLSTAGRYKEAIPPARELLALTEKAAGPDHPLVAQSLNNLGLILQKDQQLSEARTLFERAVQIEEKAFGVESPAIVRSLTNLALVWQEMKEYAAARPLLEQVVKINETAHGAEHPAVALSLTTLGELCARWETMLLHVHYWSGRWLSKSERMGKNIWR